MRAVRPRPSAAGATHAATVAERRFAGCPCTGKNLSKLVQPSLLALLAQGPAHGYELTERLADRAFGWPSPPRHPAVYRLLRQMETRRLVRSTRTASVKGPPRVRYTLTPEGRGCLARWIASLTVYDRALRNFLRMTQPRRAGVRGGAGTAG